MNKNLLILQRGAISQAVLIALILGITVVSSVALLLFAKKAAPANAEHNEAEHGEPEAEGHAEHEEAIVLTPQQAVSLGIQIQQAELGEVAQTQPIPAKLSVDTDAQAHVYPTFMGRVTNVHVSLGQTVAKGQVLATLTAPDVLQQQGDIQLASSNLKLAQQELQREQQLWQQGISAKQNLQQAEHAYQQAKISLDVARSRLSSLGIANGTQGQYVVRAPIAGVISQKDVVIGENVQPSDQLLVIDNLNQLWLDFTLPAQFASQLNRGEQIEFLSLQSQQRYSARILQLTHQADDQTGRLQIRALVTAKTQELRPNLMVNVLLQTGQQQVLRVAKTAIQEIEGKSSVFLIEEEQGQQHFSPQAVQLGASSSDGQWVEVLAGLAQGQRYVAQGSFILKSELEKNEAAHEH